MSDASEPEHDHEDEGEAEGAPIPWKAVGIAVVALALAAAVYFGFQRSRAHRQIAAAESLIAQKKYAEASAVLAHALAASPDSGDALLLKMKAELLLGNWQAAEALARQSDGKTVKGELAVELDALRQRAQAAVRAFVQARELFERGEAEKAELRLTEAAGLYPEWAEIHDALETVQGTIAFQKKDYARFLAIAEGAAQRRPQAPGALALLASALSAQYAVTGETSYRERAQKALDDAARVSQAEAEKARFEEYAPRIRHRLETREIIDRAEYDRRFRASAGAVPSRP